MMLLLTCCIMGVGLVMAQSSKVTGKSSFRRGWRSDYWSDCDGERDNYRYCN